MDRKTLRSTARPLKGAMLGIAALVLLTFVGLSYRHWTSYRPVNTDAAQTREILASVDRLLSNLIDA